MDYHSMWAMTILQRENENNRVSRESFKEERPANREHSVEIWTLPRLEYQFDIGLNIIYC